MLSNINLGATENYGIMKLHIRSVMWLQLRIKPPIPRLKGKTKKQPHPIPCPIFSWDNKCKTADCSDLFKKSPNPRSFFLVQTLAPNMFFERTKKKITWVGALQSHWSSPCYKTEPSTAVSQIQQIRRFWWKSWQ